MRLPAPHSVTPSTRPNSRRRPPRMAWQLGTARSTRRSRRWRPARRPDLRPATPRRPHAPRRATRSPRGRQPFRRRDASRALTPSLDRRPHSHRAARDTRLTGSWTPLRRRRPSGSKPTPRLVRVSARTVSETISSPGPASAQSRAAMLIGTPTRPSPVGSASPAWTPTPTSIAAPAAPDAAAPAMISRPHRTAPLTESNTTKKLSPSVRISAPPVRATASRTMGRNRPRRSAAARSPCTSAMRV